MKAETCRQPAWSESIAVGSNKYVTRIKQELGSKAIGRKVQEGLQAGMSAMGQHKIDSAVGRAIYSLRLGTVEPVFAHVCHVLGLNRFSLRGRVKVNSQWQMFCLVHNMKKIHQFGTDYA